MQINDGIFVIKSLENKGSWRNIHFGYVHAVPKNLRMEGIVYGIIRRIERARRRC